MQLIKFAKSNNKNKIRVEWYGGEPLLALDHIKYFNLLAKENKIEFNEECSESTIVYVSYGKSYLGYLISRISDRSIFLFTQKNVKKLTSLISIIT